MSPTSPTRTGSQSQNSQTWPEVVRSQNIVLIPAVPSGIEGVTVVSVPGAPQTTAVNRDDRLFGTHIREAIDTLKDSIR